MGVAYLLDPMMEKGKFIIVHYLEVTGIIDHAVVIQHQVDKTKKTVMDFILP